MCVLFILICFICNIRRFSDHFDFVQGAIFRSKTLPSFVRGVSGWMPLYVTSSTIISSQCLHSCSEQIYVWLAAQCWQCLWHCRWPRLFSHFVSFTHHLFFLLSFGRSGVHQSMAPRMHASICFCVTQSRNRRSAVSETSTGHRMRQM